MTPYFRGRHTDRYLWVGALLLVVALSVLSGWLVGVVSGRHEARMERWKDCSSRIEFSGYAKAVFVTDPCGVTR